MALTKRISGDYTIQSVNPADVVNINTKTVTINGNLVVLGNTQQVQITNSVFPNNFITLSSVVGINSGIEIDRPNPAANVKLIWNDTVRAWQITPNGITYANLATTTSTTTTNTIANVYADSSPSLGGNLNITGRTLYTDSTKGTVQIFANTAGSGGSGVYVTNTVTNNAELVTKAKAVAYSIVFG
jgi:hypothetical protein